MGERPSDGRRFVLILLGAVWLMAFIYAFNVLAAADPRIAKHDLVTFLGWQGIAGITAVALYGVGLGWEKENTVRKLSRWPLFFAVMIGCATVGLFFWSESF